MKNQVSQSVNARVHSLSKQPIASQQVHTRTNQREAFDKTDFRALIGLDILMPILIFVECINKLIY